MNIREIREVYSNLESFKFTNKDGHRTVIVDGEQLDLDNVMSIELYVDKGICNLVVNSRKIY